MPIQYYIALSATLFCIGIVGVLTRRNAIIIFMASLDEIRRERLKKLETLKEKGIDAYPAKVPRDFERERVNRRCG